MSFDVKSVKEEWDVAYGKERNEVLRLKIPCFVD